MPKKKDAASEADHNWYYSDGSGLVRATDSQATRRDRSNEDAALLLQTIVKQMGLPAVLKVLAEIAAESVNDKTVKKGGKK